MKNILMLILLSSSISCNQSESIKSISSPILGKWKLEGSLISPGSASLIFTPATKNKTIEFFSNGNFTSNGSICQLNDLIDKPGNGKFTIQDNTIISNECKSNQMRFSIKSDTLFISYQCIEACMQKYSRIAYSTND